MRRKLRFFNLALIVLLIFGFTACNTPKTATEATVTETTIPETTVSETTTAETTIPETTIPETTASKAATKYRIAFQSDRFGNDQAYEIYIMNIDGSGQERLTNNPANDWYPSFSPIPETSAAVTTTVETTAKSAIEKAE